MDRPPPPSPARLDQITTVFQNIDDPAKFVISYAPAVRKYFFAIIRNRDDAEEAIQDFLVKIIHTGFGEIRPERGRFRDYLKAAVRNAALTRLRRASASRPASLGLSQARGSKDPHETADQEWRDEWRRCLIERAWRSLQNHQNRTQGNLAYTALRLVVEHPQEDSKSLALRASAGVAGQLSSEAFRKQLSRARRIFARLLLNQVAETLQAPSPDEVEDELLDLGLMQYVRDFLPNDWRTAGTLPSLD